MPPLNDGRNEMAKETISPVKFMRGSYYHPVRILQDDGTTKHARKGGFKSEEEALESYRKFEDDFLKANRAYQIKHNKDFGIKDYLIYWLEEIYTQRIENTTRMLSAYVMYDLILPQITQDIKLRYVSAEYLNAVLEKASKICDSAGSKSRELLNIAFKDAVVQGVVSRNPVPDTKAYPTKKGNVIVLNKENTKILLKTASEGNWYLEVLEGLFLGLRKGEIYGLKYSDYDFENQTVHIQRQLASNPTVEVGTSNILSYGLVLKEPKTANSYRTLRVPTALLDEVQKRKELNDFYRKRYGGSYTDNDLLSCQENGNPHSMSSMNAALTKICSRSGLPHITPHSLRHMFASILVEKGVPLAKVSAMLGHSSINTTFEYYVEVLDENEHIIDFLNDRFSVGGD
jgi:integrase